MRFALVTDAGMRVALAQTDRLRFRSTGLYTSWSDYAVAVHLIPHGTEVSLALSGGSVLRGTLEVSL